MKRPEPKQIRAFDDEWLHRKLEAVYKHAPRETLKDIQNAIDGAFERVAMEKLEQGDI